MSRKGILRVLVTFALGAATGWVVKPASPAGVPPATMADRSRPTRTPADAPVNATRQWLDRIDTRGAKSVAKEVPLGDMKALVEGLMASMWGSMTDPQQLQLTSLIGEWSTRDREAALAWAKALSHPQQREVGLVSIAAAVARNDPRAGFEIYAELPEVATPLGGRTLSFMMRTVYNEAAQQGVPAILDVVKRTPLNKTRNGEQIQITYPEGTDFKALMDGLLAIKTPEGKPFEPSNPLGPWGLKDADAAFAYVTLRTSEGQRLELSGMVYELGEKWGTVEAKRWMGAKLASLKPAAQRALLSQTDLLGSPGILRTYIAEIPTAEAAAEFRYQCLQFTVDRKSPVGFEILNDISAVEERVATVERLRGVKDDRAVRQLLKGWEIPADRIDQIIKTVSQPMTN